MLYAAAILGVVLRAEPANAQTTAPAEPHVKAAFLYNFVKFVEWVDDHAGPITVCVAGSAAVAEALRAAPQQPRAGNRNVSVVPVTLEAMPRLCHLVYVAETDEGIARRWLTALHGSTAFSISDCERFATLGGVANFFVRDGRLRFAINVDAARRASLRISSRMLALAHIVRDEPQGGDVRTHR